MKKIESPFGTMLDEQAMIQQYYDLYGRTTAEALSRIMGNCYPSPYPKGHPFARTKRENFVRKAIEQGFDPKVVQDFLQLT